MTQTKRAKIKTCRTCGQVKALDEFWIGRNQCKRCAADYQSRIRKENPEKAKQISHRWYAEHREQEKERKHQWYLENRARVAEHDRRYVAENREKVNERTRIYWKNHKEQRREILHLYEAVNREKRNAHSRQYQKARRQKLKEEKPAFVPQIPRWRIAFADLRSSRQVLRRSPSRRFSCCGVSGWTNATGS